MYEDLVNALMAKTLRNGTNKNHSRRRVFNHKLLRVWIYYSFGFFTILKLYLLPLPELITLQSNFSEKVINISSKIVKGPSKRLLAVHFLRAMKG